MKFLGEQKECLENMWSEGSLEALVLLICGTLMIVGLWGRRGIRFPPGPRAWPIIGHLHLVNKLPHHTFRDMSKIYGHVIGLRLGQKRVVVVSSPEVAKEVLVTYDKVYCNRPPYKCGSNLFYKDDMLFSVYGPHWRKLRKVCMLELLSPKRLQELEYVRQDEVRLLLRRIDEDACGGTRVVDLNRCMGATSSRLIMRLLQSKATLEVAGENLHELVAALEEHTFPTFGDLIPLLSCFDFMWVRRMRSIHARFDKVLSAIVAERKQSTTHHDDLLQALLSKEADVNTASSQLEKLTLHDIKAILLDMIAGGIHTTSLILDWAMAELLRNPKCFHKLRKEIDTIVGEQRQITDADIAKLSYLDCIVKEVFRLHPVAPLLVPHNSIEECKMQGYTIPKNTIVMVNVWAIGRDDKVWPNANEFMPERFEGTDIDVKGQHFELLPFGAGRRICPGMNLGMSHLRASLANLVNNYDWELPNGQPPTSINMDEKHHITSMRASPLIVIPKPRVWPFSSAHKYALND